jgi:poly(3-hydroxybutyrate) depolymerase
VNKSLGLACAVAIAFSACAPHPASAAIEDKAGRFGGQQVQYKVLLPPGYDKAKAYPMVLVFTGGPQTFDMTGRTIEADWRAEAEKRGYIVVSPAAPDAGLFFMGGDRAFPEFLDMLKRDYRIAGKIHVAGHSNGGLSAYHLASKHPAYFSTVTGYPGLLEPTEMGRAAALKPLCLFMHVGDQDLGWSGAMQDEAEQLKAAGYKVQFHSERGQGHRLQSKDIGLSPRLFDEIESCK